ncbi:hypothetical protein BJ958_004811 [Nocardioides kongjuensis]|uniref:Uncharacterized protein n=1 Tax=Nocardioides kongjuensis TaxID=349522 RepID=A0A852RQN6_9ACTN|nr:hypothetical protein [Nocardioides kongjuensis]
MTWQTVTVPVSALVAELARIRRAGGTVTHCCRAGNCCLVTWFSVG